MISDRRETLQQVASNLWESDCIGDAFPAKSFTDRLLILDVEQGTEIPESVLETLREHGLVGIESVYGEDSPGLIVITASLYRQCHPQPR